jgi:transposase-like protein
MAERSPDIEDQIIDALSDGIPLAETCRKLGVGRRTVYDWREQDETFAARFARAREVGFDAIAEEALEIAEDGTNDWMERKRQDGSIEEVLNHEHVSRSKLRVETRLKLLAKWDPKRYGDKTLIGSDPDNPLPSGFDVRLLKTNGPPAG